MKSFKYNMSHIYPCNACCCAACATLHSFCDHYRARLGPGRRPGEQAVIILSSRNSRDQFGLSGPSLLLFLAYHLS